MHRIIRADVPMPLWDEFRGIMAVPSELDDEGADAAVAELVRERRGEAEDTSDGPREEAPVRPVAR